MIKISEIPAFKALILILLFIFFFKWSFYWGNNIFHLVVLSLLFILLILSILYKKQIFSYFIIIATLGLLIVADLEFNQIKNPKKIIGEIPAIFKGEIIKINKKTDRYIRCVASGSLDTKILPVQENVKISLLITGTERKGKIINVGTNIFANCFVRLPSEKQLPTDFPEDIYYFSQDIQWIARSSFRDVGIIGQSKNLRYYQARILEKVNAAIHNLYDEDISGIVKAITLGDKSDLKKEFRDYFSLTGTAHILAVSGLHVGLIATIIYFLLGFIENRWGKFLVFSIFIILFILLTDYQPSAIRAGFMAILILYVKNRERRINLLNIFSFVVLMAIIFNPNLIFSISFQMSAISVLGIAILYKPIYNKLAKLNKRDSAFVRYMLNAFSVSLAATLAVSPIVAYYFQVYSFFAPLINLLVIPLMSLGYIWIVFSLLGYYLLPIFSELYSISAEFLIYLSLIITKAIAEVKFTHYIGEYSSFLAICVSICIIYLFFSTTLKLLVFRVLVSLLVFALIYFYFLTGPKIENSLIVKEKYTALISISKDNKANVVVADRIGQQYPIKDIAMVNYLKQMNYDINFFYTGEVSRLIAAELEDLSNVRFIPLSNEDLNTISAHLKIKKLPQIIEY